MHTQTMNPNPRLPSHAFIGRIPPIICYPTHYNHTDQLSCCGSKILLEERNATISKMTNQLNTARMNIDRLAPLPKRGFSISDFLIPIMGFLLVVAFLVILVWGIVSLPWSKL